MTTPKQQFAKRNNDVNNKCKAKSKLLKPDIPLTCDDKLKASISKNSYLVAELTGHDGGIIRQ